MSVTCAVNNELSEHHAVATRSYHMNVKHEVLTDTDIEILLAVLDSLEAV